MNINELNLSQAPEKGQMLAYTREEIIFRSYGDISDIQRELEDQELLELHLFDSLKEYRAVSSESSRFATGKIEYLADFNEYDENYVWPESIIMENGKGTITVLNHIAYDTDRGSAYIDDYRLRMGD